MSSTSPSVVLYSSDGIEMNVVQEAPIPTGTRGLLVDGYSTDGYARTLLTDVNGRLFVNQGTPNTLANAWPVELTDGYGNIQGSSVNPVWVTGTIMVSNPSVGTDGAAALGFDTQVGGVTSTNAPTYTTGNLDALSLNTRGGLRIDGVYAAGAAPALNDVTYVGGLTATSAPTYTTGLLEPLSLTLNGLLRIDGVYPVNATTPTTDVTFVGGAVTTSAPAYTTGQLSALSLTTAGLLRVDGTGGVFNSTADSTVGAAPPSLATYVGALVTTAAESGLTSGDMYPFNLTTTGQLRIDGVYPLATAVATAVDMDQVGGVVTTAAPAYTTATVNALSLTTVGGLRIDSVYPAGTANASAPDVGNTGGYVTTAAPTYTTGQLEPLSLDTSGNLRVTGFVTTNKSTTSNVTTVAGATTNTSILAANATRIFASIYNGTNKNMYILCNSGAASTTNYSIVLITGSYWELPVDWTGAVNAVWANGVSGNALITEMTP
jgi:hypothetical protein